MWPRQFKDPVKTGHRRKLGIKLPFPGGVTPLLIAAGLALAAGTAFADDRKPLAVYGDWQAYTFDDDGAKACYIASAPTDHEGNYKARGEIFAIVTHRPSEKSRDVVSLLAGYSYDDAAPVEVAIDGKTFKLLPYGSVAWAPDSKLDRQLVSAMRAGSIMTVRGTSSRGTATKDTYSLSGFTKAYLAINKACGQ